MREDRLCLSGALPLKGEPARGTKSLSRLEVIIVLSDDVEAVVTLFIGYFFIVTVKVSVGIVQVHHIVIVIIVTEGGAECRKEEEIRHAGRG